MKTIHYELHQVVDTALGSQMVKLLEMQCLDTDQSGVAVFESRLAPRLREYEKFGKIKLIRKTHEEISI